MSGSFVILYVLAIWLYVYDYDYAHSYALDVHTLVSNGNFRGMRGPVYDVL
jgi:hypothetical protein